MRSLVVSVLFALSASSASAETVLGVYIFHRHGDRTSKSTPPTVLTALGADEVFVSGSHYRAQYVAVGAPLRVESLAGDVAASGQLSVTSPVDTVLQNSAQVFLQGLYPPTTAAAETLANGSVSTPPLGGYQYIPVNAVTSAATASGAEDNTWLQSGSGCDNAVVSSNSYFTSAQYLAALESTRGFYAGLLPVINRTFGSSAASFKNGYAIYDLIAVAEIHNASYPSKDLVTPTVLHQLATRADQHEWGLAFNASEPVRAISGSVLAAQILKGLNATLLRPSSSASVPRMNIQFGAYGTFMSFFGLARLHELSDNFTGVVEYASSFVLELVTNSTTANGNSVVDPKEVSVRFKFANGSASDANPPQPYPLFGRGQVLLPWTNFSEEMGKIAIGDTTHWCRVCGSKTGQCAAINNSTVSTTGDGKSTSGNSSVSTPVAGVIGALVTLVVVFGVEGLLMALVGLRIVKKPGGAGPQPKREAGAVA